MKSHTTDGWSSISMDPYLIVTTHFIDKNFTYNSVTIDFPMVPHPHDQWCISGVIYDVNFNF